MNNPDKYNCSFRQLDPQICRWHVVDAMAEKYLSTSPYAYVENNPISFTDYLGLVKTIDDPDHPWWEEYYGFVHSMNGAGGHYNSVGRSRGFHNYVSLLGTINGVQGTTMSDVSTIYFENGKISSVSVGSNFGTDNEFLNYTLSKIGGYKDAGFKLTAGVFNGEYMIWATLGEFEIYEDISGGLKGNGKVDLIFHTPISNNGNSLFEDIEDFFGDHTTSVTSGIGLWYFSDAFGALTEPNILGRVAFAASWFGEGVSVAIALSEMVKNPTPGNLANLYVTTGIAALNLVPVVGPPISFALTVAKNFGAFDSFYEYLDEEKLWIVPVPMFGPVIYDEDWDLF